MTMTRSATPTAAAATQTTTMPANSRSLLIVEDDRSARRAIAMILRRRGYAVFEAATVAEAIAWLADQPPYWMLLDLMLPDGCGVEILRKVQADRMTTKTCIITGCAAAMINEAREAGAEHTFVKPLDVDRLVTLMEGD